MNAKANSRAHWMRFLICGHLPRVGDTVPYIAGQSARSYAALRNSIPTKVPTLRPRAALSEKPAACKCLKTLAPQVGLEPTTLRLTAECSTIELLRNRGRQIGRASCRE